MPLSRKYMFLIFVLVILSAVLWKIVDTDTFYKKDITMRIFQKYDLGTDEMSEMVQKILGSTDRGFRHSIKVDQMAFSVNKGVLEHEHIKAVHKLGLTTDFFADFEIPLLVIKEGYYEFCLYANQQTSLYLDTKQIDGSMENKDLQEESVTVFLDKGHHDLRLLYFQQPKAKGLKLSYSPADSNEHYLVGQNSKYINF